MAKAQSNAQQKAATQRPEVNWNFDLKGRRDPRDVVDGITHKSAAIRALSGAGYTAAEIARLSDPDPKKSGENALTILQYKDGSPQKAIRYQHVRNVLKQPLKKDGGDANTQQANE
jgi:hypothetical protein